MLLMLALHGFSACNNYSEVKSFMTELSAAVSAHDTTARSKMFPEAWNGPWLVSCYVVEGVLVVLTLWSLHTYTGAYMPYLMRALGRDGE